MATVLAFLFGVLITGIVMTRWTRRTGGEEVLGQSATTVAAAPAIDRMATSLDALPVGVVIVDVAGNTVVRNRAARLGGLRHHQLLLDEALDELIAEARASQADTGRVLELQGPSRRVMSISVHPLDDGGAIATLSDVTERVRLDAVRTDFVANLSHELKTPVGALAVLAETLTDLIGTGELDDDDRQAVCRLADKMVGEAHRLSQAINELLELSRIELEGAAARSLTAADTIVCEAVARVRPLSEPAGIAVDVRLPPQRLVLSGDERQLISALGNLLENAVKYSDPSSTVEIGAREVEGALEFWVRDWGIGIPARDLERIFERFYRVDRARSRDTGGTGLGLSIVRHVATNHEGTVSVVSREGEGSTFVLRLPRPSHDPEEDR